MIYSLPNEELPTRMLRVLQDCNNYKDLKIFQKVHARIFYKLNKSEKELQL